MIDKDVFKREIRALIATLVLFSLTYTLRGIWDLNHRQDPGTFKHIIMALTIAFVCDFVPVMFLLIFHFRNFNKKEEKEVTEEVVNQVRGKSSEGYNTSEGVQKVHCSQVSTPKQSIVGV